MADKHSGRNDSRNVKTGSGTQKSRTGNTQARQVQTRQVQIRQPQSSGQSSARTQGSNRSGNSGRQQQVKAQSRAKQARKKRNRRIRRIICLILIVLILAGGFCYDRFKTYDSYTVTAQLNITNGSEVVEIVRFGSGYVKITESGVTYFNKKGTIWSETYTMSSPVYDICRGYLAVGDIKQNEVYIFDKEGLVNTVSTQYTIIDIEVSKAGVIAAATDDDEANYIEVYDRNGSEILTARSVFESSGYLADITLSSDGTKLAAAFINVDLLDIVSRVVFYDFSQDDEESDVIVGGFNQYTDTVLTNVEFLSGDRVVAVGDNAYTVYDFSGTPEIICENLEFEYTIRSVFFSERYFGFILDDPTEAYNYIYQVYNRSGEIAAEAGFDFSYTKAQFYGRSVMLTSANACHIYTFEGSERFGCAFEDSITAMYPAGYASLIYATASETDFIRMK